MKVTQAYVKCDLKYAQYLEDRNAINRVPLPCALTSLYVQEGRSDQDVTASGNLCSMQQLWLHSPLEMTD